MDKPIEVVVKSGAPYARYLEEGTKKMDKPIEVVVIRDPRFRSHIFATATKATRAVLTDSDPKFTRIEFYSERRTQISFFHAEV